MNRRSLLKFGAALGASQLASSSFAAVVGNPGETHPIVLYCDLAVNPSREAEMLAAFHGKFKPAAMKFDGFIDLKMLKLQTVIQGRPAPAPGINYRFQLTYQSEEKRQHWIHSDVHQSVWPLIESTVVNKDYLVLLTEAQ